MHGLDQQSGNRDNRAMALIGVGFALVIVLMVALVLVGLSRLAALYETSEKLVGTEQAALEQLYIMHSASRERTLLLHDIALASDPFKREEKIEVFYDAGAKFGTARTRLLALNIPDTERQLLEAQRIYAHITIPIQQSVIELAQQGRHEEAHRLLDEEAMPAAKRVISALDQLLVYELAESRALEQEAREKKQTAVRFIIGSAAAAVILTISIAVFLTRRTTRLVSRLLQTSAHLRDTLQDLEYQKFALDQHAIVSIADADGKIIYANKRFCEISGYPPNELLGKDQRTFQSNQHDQSFFRKMWATIEAGNVWHGEVCNRNKNGEHYWLETTIVPFLDDNRVPYQYVSILTDITRLKAAEQALGRSKEQLEVTVQERTAQLERANQELHNEVAERRRLEESLRQMVSTDPLTGIYNRRKFDEVLVAESARAARYRLPLALILFDVDRFKSINDTFGHQRGDQVLIQLARFVKNSIRETDVFARWGGEEFIVLTPEVDLHGAEMFAEKLRRGIECMVLPGVGYVTCSFGVSSLNAEADAEDMLRRADAALYKAKDHGRNLTKTA